MDKIIVSASELTEVKEASEQPPRIEAKLAPAIPWWGRLVMAPLVLLLPVLCLIAIIVRVAFRTQPPRTRLAWTSYLSTLLIVSGFLTSAAAVVALSLGSIPAIVSTGMAELDERTEFPDLPSTTVLSGSDAAQQLKSLVAVITPTGGSFFSRRELPSNSFGAGMLLHADSAGYLFATARHVVGGGDLELGKKTPRALISMASGVWAGADVIARHTSLDLVLLWIPRHSGKMEFTQPIAHAKEGESIFVIGHPEGLKFTLSTGIISRMEESILQITAPISPGNSGGPVYDPQGNLVGVVNETVDKAISPNAENINFAVNAQAFLHEAGWEFVQGGREKLQQFVRDVDAVAKPRNQSLHEASPNSHLTLDITNHGHD